MKRKKKEIESDGTERRAVQLPRWLHPVMLQVASAASYGVGEAYTEAVQEWIKKAYGDHEKVRAVLDIEARSNPEVRLLLGPAIVPSRKPSSR